MYIRELVRNTDENINAISRELSNLEEIGILTSKRRGNKKYYTINKNIIFLSNIFMEIFKLYYILLKFLMGEHI